MKYLIAQEIGLLNLEKSQQLGIRGDLLTIDKWVVNLRKNTGHNLLAPVVRINISLT